MAVAYVRIYRVAKQQQQHIYSLAYSMGQCIVNLDQVCTAQLLSNTARGSDSSTVFGIVALLPL